MTVLLRNFRVISPDFVNRASVSLVIEGERIKEIFDEREPEIHRYDEIFDGCGTALFPGFIDVHIHGAVGVDAMTASGADLEKMAAFLAAQGTTAWLPTFVPASEENYESAIRAVEDLMKIQKDKPIAQVLGVHYEGVFANEKMCGALRPEFFKKFTGDELAKLPRLERGIHLTTLAPEIEGGVELVRELRKQNWIPSIGHTRADIETLNRAFEAGARHVTHLFNAMTGVHHREIGVAGWALMRDEISCEIIADGVHVHPEMLKFAHKNKPSDKFLLVSDAVLPTGLGDGDYEIWGEKISVAGGRTRNERGSLAGSVITMLDAVKMMLSLGFSEVQVSQMASANPARLLGTEKTRGSIQAGKRADLVALDEKGNVRLSLIGGQVAFRRL